VSSIVNLYGQSTYAVKTDGTVWRWGAFYTQNPIDPGGDGTDVVIKTPTKMAGLFGVKSVAVEQFSGYAVKSDGTVWGWEYLNAPAQVAGLSNVTSISLDMSGCGGIALKRDGTLWEFHCDRYYTGSGVAQLTGIDNVKNLTAGTCDDGSDTQRAFYAIKSDGSLWAWGDNRKGQLGDGTKKQRDTPVQVSGLTGVAKVNAETCAVFAVTTSGTVWAWGANEGQLGDGTKTNRIKPVRITALSKVAEIVSIGSYASETTWYARTTGGLVYYWGCGWPSHYGDISAKYQRCGKTPVQLPGLTGASKIVAYDKFGGGDYCSFGSSGSDGGYAIKTDGSLWVWGGHAGAMSPSCGGKGEWVYSQSSASASPKSQLLRVNSLSHVAAVFPYDSGAYVIGAQPLVDAIRTSLSTVYLKQKTSYQLLATAQLKNSKSKVSVKYKSSNTKVVTVDSKGKLTAKKVKKATKVTVTITADYVAKKVTVWVVPKAGKVKVSATAPKVLKKGQVTWITASAKKGTNPKLTFKSSNKAVATVDKFGKLLAKKVGKATITVKVGGKSVRKSVTVK
jgi:alpha-tubulin suppressor-like RCC1 family protein